MTSISKKMYINNLDDKVNKYNSTYRTVKVKPVDVNPGLYIDFNKEKKFLPNWMFSC